MHQETGLNGFFNYTKSKQFPILQTSRQSWYSPVDNGGYSARTNISSTTLSPAKDYHIAIPSDTIPIRFNPGEKIFLWRAI